MSDICEVVGCHAPSEDPSSRCRAHIDEWAGRGSCKIEGCGSRRDPYGDLCPQHAEEHGRLWSLCEAHPDCWRRTPDLDDTHSPRCRLHGGADYLPPHTCERGYCTKPALLHGKRCEEHAAEPEGSCLVRDCDGVPLPLLAPGGSFFFCGPHQAIAAPIVIARRREIAGDGFDVAALLAAIVVVVAPHTCEAPGCDLFAAQGSRYCGVSQPEGARHLWSGQCAVRGCQDPPVSERNCFCRDHSQLSRGFEGAVAFMAHLASAAPTSPAPAQSPAPIPGFGLLVTTHGLPPTEDAGAVREALVAQGVPREEATGPVDEGNPWARQRQRLGLHLHIHTDCLWLGCVESRLPGSTFCAAHRDAGDSAIAAESRPDERRLVYIVTLPPDTTTEEATALNESACSTLRATYALWDARRRPFDAVYRPCRPGRQPGVLIPEGVRL